MYVTATTEKRIGTMNKEIKVGNVLGSAWGYGAINRDFYIVTAVSPKGRVKIGRISKEKVKTADIEDGEVNNLVSPRVEVPATETGYKAVFTDSDGDSFIKISSYERAYKIAETGEEAEALAFTETNFYYV
jgi:alpha-D-ribose 1-methylphosphonate 5-triphosphate synthase subunit PhnI